MFENFFVATPSTSHAIGVRNREGAADEQRTKAGGREGRGRRGGGEKRVEEEEEEKKEGRKKKEGERRRMSITLRA